MVRGCGGGTFPRVRRRAGAIGGAEDHTPPLAIASDMKRNTRLYHIPAVLYLRGAGEINLSELYNRGFADVAAADTPEDETAERITALAQAHRRHIAIRKALESARGSGLTDPTTGLFTPELFASHLARIAEGARMRRRPLSVAVLRVADTDAVGVARKGGWPDRAPPQTGAMVYPRCPAGDRRHLERELSPPRRRGGRDRPRPRGGHGGGAEGAGGAGAVRVHPPTSG